jgi:hypothetical protein
MYSVLEGNRRIAALKLVSSPELAMAIQLPKNLTQKYRKLYERAATDLPREINCAVLSREEANHWIQLKHTGENNGVGVVPWDGVATQRFRGSSTALQAIDLVAESPFVDADTKAKLARMAITNVERMLGTPEVRKALGVDVKNNQLILVAPDEEAVGRLALLVSAVANGDVSVSNIRTKEQRVAYAHELAGMPLPNPITTNKGKDSAGTKPTTGRSTSGKKINPNRKTLIPPTLSLRINQPRINKIYDELQAIKVDEFVNCCGVMFRVFLELSIDHYAAARKIPLKRPRKPAGTPAQTATAPPIMDKEMSLAEKLDVIIKDLEQRNICTQGQLAGIRAVRSARTSVLSVDNLHSFVHNKDYSPTATELKTTWDNIQPFMEALLTQ